MSRPHFTPIPLLPALWIALGMLTGGVAEEDWPNDAGNPNPPIATATFMANGIFDAADPTYTPPTADDFDRVIMGRDDAAVAARKQEAIDYFQERFGVDFSQADFAQGGSIALLHTLNDPRWNYRCYRLPHRPVPPEGLIVNDAQYVMAVVGPEATLYGSWGGAAGTVVPGGTVAVNGEYLIQGSRRYRVRDPRNIHIRFASVSPIFNAISGNIKFDCRLQSDYFGTGVALGRQEFYLLSDGMTQIAINNVLQFPAPEWSLQE